MSAAPAGPLRILSLRGDPPRALWAGDTSPLGADKLEEVIVTAERSAEWVLDVPASTTVIGAEEIERLHATNLRDLEAAAPGFTLIPFGS